MGLKDLFSIKKEGISTTPPQDEYSSKSKTEHPINFEQWGRDQATDLGGTPSVIQPALDSAYLHAKKKIMEDELQQQQRKAEVESYIVTLQKEKVDLEKKKINKKTELDHEERKIEEAREEITAIRNDPSRILKQPGSPIASFIIGLLIILFLTIYLFVFYSSAAFSAFFKVFDPGSIGIATAIFDAQALQKAFQEGFTEMILIITIPAVFLGLGYLIHRFSTAHNSTKLISFSKITALMLVTFAFDTILAYEITEKIYEVGRTNSFNDMPEFTLTMAFSDMRFWMIIFSGFVVYIIWGLVFNFVMEEYYKFDRVKVAIEELEKKIRDYKCTCKSIKKELDVMDTNITKIEGDIVKNKNKLTGTIVFHSDVALEINNFVRGWLAYMSFNKFSEKDKKEVVNIRDKYLLAIKNQFETIS